MKTNTAPRPFTTESKASFLHELRCMADRINEAWHACHPDKPKHASTFYYRDLMKFAQEFEENSHDENFVRNDAP